jgi:hypothetical protein
MNTQHRTGKGRYVDPELVSGLLATAATAAHELAVLADGSPDARRAMQEQRLSKRLSVTFLQVGQGGAARARVVARVWSSIYAMYLPYPWCRPSSTSRCTRRCWSCARCSSRGPRWRAFFGMRVSSGRVGGAWNQGKARRAFVA